MVTEPCCKLCILWGQVKCKKTFFNLHGKFCNLMSWASDVFMSKQKPLICGGEKKKKDTLLKFRNLTFSYWTLRETVLSLYRATGTWMGAQDYIPRGPCAQQEKKVWVETPHVSQSHGHNMLRRYNTLKTHPGKAQTPNNKRRHLSQEQKITDSIRRMKTRGCTGCWISHFRSPARHLGCLTPLTLTH